MTESKSCPITGKECFPWKCMWGVIEYDTGLYTCGVLVPMLKTEVTVCGRRKVEECESAS